jgi:methylmalonyl-CoA carboxyltransferase small subunit
LKHQIVINGKTYEVEYDDADENASPSAPPIEPAQSIVLPTPPVPGSSQPSEVDESKLCRSPVAGIVARVNVEVGQSVQSGEIVVVVEAMKMENNLATAVAARVNSVKVKVGDTVKVTQIMVEFE